MIRVYLLVVLLVVLVSIACARQETPVMPPATVSPASTSTPTLPPAAHVIQHVRTPQLTATPTLQQKATPTPTPQPTATPPPQPTATPTPTGTRLPWGLTGIYYDIAAEAPPEQVAVIMTALRMAQDFLDTHLVGGIPEDGRSEMTVKIVATGKGNELLSR